MNVLNLVTNPHAQFFERQVETLRARGVAGRTIAVPGSRTTTDQTVETRSPLDYLRFYPEVLRASLDDYDVVHANYGLTAPAAIAQPTRPVVLSLWGSDLLGGVGWLSRLCARLADAVIVMSDEMAAELAPVESYVIPHGVDLELFRPLPRAVARESVGWSREGFHVLFPYAEGRAVKDYSRAEAVVATSRDRMGDDIHLHSLHGVAHERMPLYLNAADALLLTSKREGSPNSVKEAMACNVPVVATDVGDVPDLLEQVTSSHVGRTDRELVAGLVDVLSQGEDSDGREYIEAYGLDRMADRILQVYQSVQ
jgi:glycosyltransferase involved in cell wall biosynthesis